MIEPATMAPAGFADLATGSQQTFRVLMDALARPGLIRPLAAEIAPPAPLSPNLAAIALTLLDFETSVWLDGALDHPDVLAYLRFETGVKIVADPADAAFALIADPAAMPPLSAFAQGVPDYPDRSTTLVIDVPGFAAEGWTFTGPGIRESVSFRPHGLPDEFGTWLADNHARFPLGVDLVFASRTELAALPRSSKLVEA